MDVEPYLAGPAAEENRAACCLLASSGAAASPAYISRTSGRPFHRCDDQNQTSERSTYLWWTTSCDVSDFTPTSLEPAGRWVVLCIKKRTVLGDIYTWTLNYIYIYIYICACTMCVDPSLSPKTIMSLLITAKLILWDSFIILKHIRLSPTILT